MWKPHRFALAIVPFGFVFALMLAASLLGPVLWAQDPVQPAPAQADRALQRAVLAGNWALHPYQKGTPPPPPPVFSSQRSPGDTDAPLTAIARVRFRVQAGQITGTAVFPEGIVLREDNRDVTGRPEVELQEVEFDGKVLKFRATVEGKLLEAELQAQGSRFLGSWRIDEEDRGGDLYLVRRR